MCTDASRALAGGQQVACHADMVVDGHTAYSLATKRRVYYRRTAGRVVSRIL
jgi:hypothetical protein